MRLRLLIALVGIVAVILIAHDVPLASHLERVEQDRLATKLERDAFILAGRVEEALEDGVAEGDRAINALVARYSEFEDVRVVVVSADATGVAGSESDGSVGEDFSNRPEITSALQGQPSTGERESSTLGEELFYVAVPVLSGDDVVGAVRISAPASVVDDRAADRVRSLFVVAGISLFMAVGVALVLAVYVTNPLERLRGSTHALARGELGARADPSRGPPEVRELASSFNAMAERIEGLVEQQRAFAGTASHQLRTPLTALRLRLDQLAATADDDEVLARTDAAIAETERLHRIIEGLLALSRAEGTTDIVTADLAAVVVDRVEAWTPLADEREVRLVTGSVASTTVRAIDGAIEQIVDNLIDNALEVSAPGSTIEVSISSTQVGSTTVELHIVDEGPGLSEDERRRAFDRFWRSTGAVSGGSGLGLSIVRQLARAAGGDAELRDAPTGGLDAVVTFVRA